MPDAGADYVLGCRSLSMGLHERATELGAAWREALDASNESFARALNAANAVAFGGLGMPPWVQVDCATLPTVVCGRTRLWETLPAALREDLRAADRRLQPHGAPWRPQPGDVVPVSGFAAARTESTDTIVAFSLFSVIAGAGLGLRAKALGLRLHEAATQVGVTQYGNPALRIHATFGPLDVVYPRVPGHVHPDRSLVYRVRVPEDATLADLARTGRPLPISAPCSGMRIPLNEETGRRVAALQEAHGRVRILAPAHERTAAGKALVLGVG